MNGSDSILITEEHICLLSVNTLSAPSMICLYLICSQLMSTNKDICYHLFSFSSLQRKKMG